MFVKVFTHCKMYSEMNCIGNRNWFGVMGRGYGGGVAQVGHYVWGGVSSNCDEVWGGGNCASKKRNVIYGRPHWIISFSYI